MFYWAVSLSVIAKLIYRLLDFKDSGGLTQPMMRAFGLLILSMALNVLFDSAIFRVFRSAINYFSKSASKTLMVCLENTSMLTGVLVFWLYPAVLEFGQK